MRLLVLSDAPDGAKSLLPALELLDHEVASAPLLRDSLGTAAACDVVLVDARTDLPAAATACRSAAALERGRPVLVVIPESSLVALKPSWGFVDWLLPTAGPGEVEARLRLAAAVGGPAAGRSPAHVGELSIDEETYVVRLRGVPLDLTYREFELLKFLAQNPGRVFTRDHLLEEVWGYDYYGGTRTVDVHIRRLRAKLGPEHEVLIGTVRGVGYKLDPPGSHHGSAEAQAQNAGRRRSAPSSTRGATSSE